MEIIIILSLGIWFLWVFILGGFARAYENKIEWFLLFFSFIFIVIILPIIHNIT